MSVAFSDVLIKEYQAEMYETFGVVVSDADAQVQLMTLVRSMFPTPTLQGGVGNEVGGSITPTSGQD
jgi:hypothetical protein